ncbi:MAG: MFS transporter [Planctomycetota bacterium]
MSAGVRGRLARLNPFAGLPNPREVWAWGMFDLANQSFTLLIITLLFSLYVTQVVVPQPVFDAELQALVDAARASDDVRAAAAPEVVAACDRADAAERQGKFVWSLLHGGSLLAVVVLSPVIGAYGDIRARRKLLLMLTGLASGALTCSLGFVGPGMVILAATLYIPANVAYQIGENFLASFLPDVSTRRNMGRISAIGWTMGYAGALALLTIVTLAMLLFDLKQPGQWRPLFVFAGLWFLLGIVPAGLFLRRDAAPRETEQHPLRAAVRRVAGRVHLAAKHRQLARFLLAFLIYGFGVQTIIGFASIIARDFGFGDVSLVLFVAQITITAVIAAVATSFFQDRLGAKRTVLIYLGVWVASCSAMVAIAVVWPGGGPQWPLWIVGNGLGFGLGGIGTASRSLVGRLTPAHRTAEFFGLWGMIYKLAGAIGVLSFGAIARTLGEVASLVLLLSFFAVGTLLMLRVNERAGVREAMRNERQARRDGLPAG